MDRLSVGYRCLPLSSSTNISSIINTETIGQVKGERFVALIGHAPVAVAELIRQSGVTAAEAQLFLLELELGDRLDRHAGGKVSLRAQE